MPINTASNAAIPNIGMNCVGCINRSGTLWQLHDVTFRREDVNLVREQIHFDAFNKLEGVTCALLHLEQALHPFSGAGVGGGCGVTLGFIQPMGGDAIIGHILHFPSSYLYFYGHSMHALEDGMKRLVAVGFGDGNIVSELPGHRFVEAVHGAESPVTRIYRVHDDPESKNIHDVRE